MDLTPPRRRYSMDFATAMTKNQGNKLPTGNEIRPRRIPLPDGIERVSVGDNAFSSGVQRNPSQKGRPLPESSWQLNGVQAARSKSNGNGSAKGSPCTVNDYDIVASGGEIARNNYVARNTPVACIVNERKEPIFDASAHGKRSDSFIERVFSGKPHPKDTADSTDFGTSDRSARYSFSIPSCLREGLWKRQKNERNAIEGSILKSPSAFLANLTHSASRIAGKRSSEDRSRQGKSSGNVRSAESACSTKYWPSGGYYSILNSVTNELGSFRRSPSVRTLPSERRKKSVGRVKKSVSFSSDTSFEEKRATYRRATVHEVKIYRKGVLQDRSVREPGTAAKVPSSWEEASEGRSALLRAARDADDTALSEIAAQVRKFGFRDMDVNTADGSGRTAVSYMAGNGALAMLELTLSAEGVNPNVPDNEGNTPLHFAAQAGQTECLNVLLQRCPDIEVDARNASGFTPLMKAALQGRTKCAKILLFAGANPTLRDHGRGLRAEQWARFCGRYVCAEVIERFARHRLLERSTSCRWGSEPELAAKVFQGKVMPLPSMPLSSPCSGLKSKIRKVFRTTSGPDRNFSLVSQLTSAALCASSPALPKSSEVPPVVKSLLRPLSVPQLRVTLVPPQDFLDQSKEKYGSSFSEKIESTVGKPARSKKKTK